MFWYYVAPYTSQQWNVLFEGQPKPYFYDSEDEALKAARKAARENFDKHEVPSGVRVKDGDGWRKDEIYGED